MDHKDTLTCSMLLFLNNGSSVKPEETDFLSVVMCLVKKLPSYNNSSEFFNDKSSIKSPKGKDLLNLLN